MRAADVKVGQQYVLQIPSKSSRFPNLAWQVDRYRPRGLGRKPWLVTVQALVERMDDEPGGLFLARTKATDPTAKPVPSAVIRIDGEHTVRTALKVPEEELSQFGLTADRDYYVEGLVEAHNQWGNLEVVHAPQIIGEVVPLTWLTTRKAHAEAEKRYNDWIRKMRATRRIIPPPRSVPPPAGS